MKAILFVSSRFPIPQGKVAVKADGTLDPCRYAHHHQP